ncbi:MAG: DUF362 domain-containing protein [Sedimentisphaerales bacterium]|nr:DUF362 domain-containing protein [Sedimentisphaerales bacterium]
MAEVFLIKASVEDGEQVISEKARKLFNTGSFAGCFKENDCTAVKVHVGEAGNTTYMRAPYIKGLVDELIALKTKPFVTDTTTLYVGRRHNAIDHTVLAAEHGFCFDKLGVPFIVPDGLFGTSETPVAINGEIDREVFIASGIVQCQSILSVAHLTGHVAACLGATIKTLGMGCASKKGKLKQHAALKLGIGNNCTRCGVCYDHCPADAITIDDVKAHINQDKCIGCAECMAACRFGAVVCNWGQEDEVLQKSIAEHALGVVKGKENRIVCFNFLMSVTKDCDCFDKPDMKKMVDDIGIAASTDPVALDKATLDLTENMAGKTLANLIGNDKLDPRYQIEHAEQIGLGSSSYELIEVD